MADVAVTHFLVGVRSCGMSGAITVLSSTVTEIKPGTADKQDDDGCRQILTKSDCKSEIREF
ncbi:MAG: hypothetical protein ACI8VE_001232 [Natrialbaceae archaeon]|jgi:hypothetical protein